MRILAGVVAACAVVLLSAGPSFGADPTREDRRAALPQTAADHEAMAKRYDESAAAYRQEAALHRDMAAQYRSAHPAPKDGATMEKHCMMIVKDAEKLAEDAKVMADYHRMRATEMQRK